MSQHQRWKDGAGLSLFTIRQLRIEQKVVVGLTVKENETTKATGRVPPKKSNANCPHLNFVERQPVSLRNTTKISFSKIYGCWWSAINDKRMVQVTREMQFVPFSWCRLVLQLIFLVQVGCWGRSYRDVKLIHSMGEHDVFRGVYREVEQILHLTYGEVKNVFSTSNPVERQYATNGPTSVPSHAPKQATPTKQPKISSSSTPTSTKSLDPSSGPTSSPTISPTDRDPYPPSEVPLRPDPWYFNFDTSNGAKYGPGTIGLALQEAGFFETGVRNDNWGRVSRPPDDYWKEFTDEGFGPWSSVLQIHEPMQNQCSVGNFQSPIDLRENGALCQEHHEVRSLPGDFQVTGQHVEKRIEPGKLRLVYERRPCANLSLTACHEPDPPAAGMFRLVEQRLA